MFYRATERSEGSGLGLYIVKKVADKLNATIDVESQELEGTTFTVTIPNGK
jgi:signal transduction histidine kinase